MISATRLRLLSIMLLVITQCCGCTNAGSTPRYGEFYPYRQKGITFRFNRNGSINSIDIYKASAVQAKNNVGTKDAVPGIGAWGVLIGDKRQVLKNLNCKKPYIEFNNHGKGMARCDFKDGRKMLVNVKNDHIEHIIIIGAFRASRGITQRSTCSQIEKIFGRPDAKVDTFGGFGK